MNILFRADSSSFIGTGHIMRDLVLVNQFPNDNITFAVRDLTGNINYKIDEAGYKKTILETNDFEELNDLIQKLSIEMVVIDHYDIDYNFEKKLKDSNPNLKIFVFDDLYEKHFCDILLNQNIYAQKEQYDNLVPQNCELRCGSEYTLLRDEFIKAKQKKLSKSVNKKMTIFVAMGGTDILNLNPKILDVLSSFHNIEVKVVTTVSNQNLQELENFVQNKDLIELCINCTKVAELMAQSDLAIITPSVTANEVYFMELPIIAIQVANNQKYMSDFFKQNNIPVLEELDKKLFQKEVKMKIENLQLEKEIDLLNFINLSLEQKKMVLEWRNHPDVKKWMYTQEDISLDKHLKFIEHLADNKDKLYFLVKKNQDFIGVIDFYNFTNKTSVEFGLYSNPYTKIPGVGRILEQISIDYAFNNLKVKKLKLEVFSSNIQVRNLHKKYKFVETCKKMLNDKEIICMELINENR